jgi:hypothetical protein
MLPTRPVTHKTSLPPSAAARRVAIRQPEPTRSGGRQVTTNVAAISSAARSAD